MIMKGAESRLPNGVVGASVEAQHNVATADRVEGEFVRTLIPPRRGIPTLNGRLQPKGLKLLSSIGHSPPFQIFRVGRHDSASRNYDVPCVRSQQGGDSRGPCPTLIVLRPPSTGRSTSFRFIESFADNKRTAA